MSKSRSTSLEIICDIRDRAPEPKDYDTRIALATRRLKSSECNDCTDLVVWWTVYERLVRLGHDSEWMAERYKPNQNRVIKSYNQVPEWDTIKMAKTLQDNPDEKEVEFENGEANIPKEDDQSEGNSE